MSLEYAIKAFSGGAYTGLQLVDIDLDGTLELLAGHRDSSSIEIWEYYPNNDSLQLSDTISFSYHVHDFQAADFDKDGDLDVMAGIRFNGLEYATNLGNGPWSVSTVDWTYSWRVQVADFDQDGNLDVLDGVDTSDGLKVFYGDGAGGFAEGVAPVLGARGLRVNVVDLNGDGLMDILGIRETSGPGDANEVKAYLNLGDRTWSETPFVSGAAEYPTVDVAEGNVTAGDVDGDGYIDQVASEWDSRQAISEIESSDIVLFHGHVSDEGFGWTSQLIDTLPGDRKDTGLADFNGDGLLDIYASSLVQPSFYIYLNDGAGGFSREVIDLGKAGPDFHSVTVGDLNRDGRADIIVGSGDEDNNPGGFQVLFQLAPAAPITGTEGDDDLVGTFQGEQIQALGGADMVEGLGGADVISGGAGDDLLTGGDGDDTVTGDGGDDVLSGDDGDDALDGSDGDDQILGGDGDDSILGGAGNDRAMGGIGADILAGGSGADRLLGDAGDDTISGDDGADRLHGGDGADSLAGGFGDDLLSGDAGDDMLRGNANNDHLLGGEGDDLLCGGSGQDSLSGDAGQDVIRGGSGADSLSGGEDADQLAGGSGDDQLGGDGGDDRLSGEDGADRIDGGAGADLLAGGAGSDAYTGGAGADRFQFRAHAALDGVPDADLVTDYVAADGDVLDLGACIAITGTTIGLSGDLVVALTGGDTVEFRGITDVADLVLGTFGTEANDSLAGTDGADTLFALAGDDTVKAGAGDDTIYGGPGGDTMTGGAGQDRFVLEPDASGAPPAGDVDWVQWTKAEGGNGHWYALVQDGLTWEESRVAAEGLAGGANLATITSEVEQAFINEAFQGQVSRAFIGLFQSPGAAEPADGWQWVTGEKLGYTNWDSGEPNEGYGEFSEDYGELIIGHKWNDLPNTPPDFDRAYLVESEGTGYDKITDFTPGEDAIDLRALPVGDFTTLAGLLETDGADTIVQLSELGGRDLALVNVNVLDLGAGDFFL